MDVEHHALQKLLPPNHLVDAGAVVADVRADARQSAVPRLLAERAVHDRVLRVVLLQRRQRQRRRGEDLVAVGGAGRLAGLVPQVVAAQRALLRRALRHGRRRGQRRRLRRWRLRQRHARRVGVVGHGGLLGGARLEACHLPRFAVVGRQDLLHVVLQRQLLSLLVLSSLRFVEVIGAAILRHE